ncbi:winged helix-turn-helix transcriptional regulator [Marispirochaeta sp.]|uniref:winged helix-turn-helix transcriptional regulator n=1 Tax=Marispirochaeta sp. TaxID=2038653 RepID=UPI0029C6DF2B|nr:winged helix-turn-helix transcriptional regulator [Marispirochaeta sp.]
MDTEDKELEILENIYHSSSSVRQRDLAEVVGLSLGMTNAILKRLVKKGLLTVKKVNNRNIRYAVSPSGVEAITRKSYRYFKRTIKNVVFYKESIESLVREGKESGYDGIFLKGRSDLDFIVEHSCFCNGLDYVRDPDCYNGRVFTIYAESYTPDDESRRQGTSFLQELFVTP